MNVFDWLDYKTALRRTLELRRVKLGNKVTFERMATACGIQKTYLSRVLNSPSTHLNQDQLYQACLYLGMTKAERRFVSLLLELERSTCARRQEELDTEVSEIRRRNARSEAYMTSTPAVSPTAMAGYFLDPEAILVHVFLTSAKYSKELGTIQRKLNLSDARIGSILAQLRQHGLIEMDANGGLRVLKDRLHLPADAETYPAYRAMQRFKTLERLRSLGETNSYSFSAVFTADEATRSKVKGVLLGALAEIESLAAKAPTEEVYQMNLDLFDWSAG